MCSKDDTKKREVLIQGFEKKFELGRAIAEDLECGIWRIACPNMEPLQEGSDSFKEYKSQYKRLCTHLRRSGGSLARRLANGEVRAELVASMADEALMADSQRTELEQFRQENLHEAMGVVETAHWTPSAEFTCPACEKTDCIYLQSYNGSHAFDDNNREPAITLRCLGCKHLWKEEEIDGGRMALGDFAVCNESAPTPQLQASLARADGKVGSSPPLSATSAVPAEAADAPVASATMPLRGVKRAAEAPSIWGEAEGRVVPTWMLPA